MTDSTYQPKPIDVSRIVLPAELDSLIEELARNTHEVWARERIQQGWRYGPQHDGERKQHPSLVPFDELPESEKRIDRETVSATLKAMLALGFHFGPSSE